ncbi:MAG: radical SAM protein [Sulfuritalea sp.]|nr:radical SAM protein [Sulfuritalea sp.]
MKGVVLLRVDRVEGSGGHPRHLHPALDLKILEAGLGAARGIAATLVDGWLLPGGPQAWVASALAARPRVAVIKAETWCLPEAIECALGLRHAGVLTIAIGQQVSHVMRAPALRWREAFDLALAGDAEEELLALLPRLLDDDEFSRHGYWRQFEQGHHFAVAAPERLPRAVFSDAEMMAFAFPFPLPGKPLRRWAYVLSASGCPHRCRHCSTVVRKSSGERLRTRDPVQVADEVAAQLAAGAEAIAFEDDTFFVDRRHFLAICEELVRRNIAAPWIANARPDELDQERVAAAAAAGARLLKLGIETVTPRLLELMGKARHGAAWKLQTEQGLARLKRHGIGAVGLFLIGLPTQTAAEVEATLRWAQELAPDYVQVQIFRSYPDIPWWQDLPASLRDAGAAYHYGPILSSAAAIPADALPGLQRNFYRRYYLRAGFVLPHARRCWRHYCHPAGIAAALGRLRYMARREVSAQPAAQGVQAFVD